MENFCPALLLVNVTAVTLAVNAPNTIRTGLSVPISAREIVGVAEKATLTAVLPAKTDPPPPVCGFCNSHCVPVVL